MAAAAPGTAGDQSAAGGGPGGMAGGPGRPPLTSDEEAESLSGSEDESSEEEEYSGGEDTGSGDLKSTGQILWIRGLSRLQTQVRIPALYCFQGHIDAFKEQKRNWFFYSFFKHLFNHREACSQVPNLPIYISTPLCVCTSFLLLMACGLVSLPPSQPLLLLLRAPFAPEL